MHRAPSMDKAIDTGSTGRQSRESSGNHGKSKQGAKKEGGRQELEFR